MPFKCEECNRKFKSKQGLLSHQRSVCHKGKYKCKQCGRSFKSNQNLKSHKLICTKLSENGSKSKTNGKIYEQKANPRNKCQHCNRNFKNKQGLLSHERAILNKDTYEMYFERCRNML